MIKFVDMFSGIGGFREGLTRAGGFECVGHCEIGDNPAFTFRTFLLRLGLIGPEYKNVRINRS